MLNKIIFYTIASGIIFYKATQPCHINDCDVTCSGVFWDWFKFLQGYLQLTRCHSNGINLTLPINVSGTNFNDTWWRLSYFEINVIGLQLDLGNTNYIEGQPFDLDAFYGLTYLRLNNLHTKTLPESTFNGLNSLEELIITNATIYSQSDGSLASESLKKLRSFSLIGRNDVDSISISSFIGNTCLSNLEYVKIQYNLDIIDDTSLRAISSVEVLDLSDCYITTIKEHSFDTLGSNLKLLNLEGNKLTTLPTGLFSELQLTSANLKIHLSGNPWHCDYSLVYVQELLINNRSSFDQDILCASPDSQNGSQVKDAELCTASETTDPDDTTTITTTEETTTTIDKNDEEIEFPTRKCHGSYNKISISPQTHEMQLSFQSEEIFVKLEENQSEMVSEMVLIWFGSETISNHLPMYQQSEIVDCATDLASTIAVNNLKNGVTYTFCLMSKDSTTVSPLNCLTYHRQIEKEFNRIWVYNSSKLMIISIISVCLVIAIVFGFFIGTFLLRRCKNISFDFGSLFYYPKTRCVNDTANTTADILSDPPTTINTTVEHNGYEDAYEDECENYNSVVK